MSQNQQILGNFEFEEKRIRYLKWMREEDMDQTDRKHYMEVKNKDYINWDKTFPDHIHQAHANAKITEKPVGSIFGSVFGDIPSWVLYGGAAVLLIIIIK